jgi:DNA-binding HxlR family transcriptional regulator
VSEYVVSNPEEMGSSTEWCPMCRTLDVVANRSTFLILREAFYGTTRFDDFASRSGLSEAIASARLKSLVNEGMLERRPYQEPGERTRYEYHLTEAGGQFFPIIVAMMQWGSRWRGPSPLRIQHLGCGAAIEATLRCEAGHDEFVPSDIELVPTKSARALRRAASSEERGRKTE